MQSGIPFSRGRTFIEDDAKVDVPIDLIVRTSITDESLEPITTLVDHQNYQFLSRQRRIA
jgi:hypothetical protein